MFVVLIGHQVTHLSDLCGCFGGGQQQGSFASLITGVVSVVVKLSAAFLLLEPKLLTVTDEYGCWGLIH